MRQLCAERGDEIVIGFLGGLEKLRATSFAELQAKRSFKWDNSTGGVGTKIPTNWMTGSVFLTEIKTREQAG